MKKVKRLNKQSKDGDQSCPKGKYWVKPHERKRMTKDGKVYIQKVKGYCCSVHCVYQKIADEEKMLLDHLYFALTLYVKHVEKITKVSMLLPGSFKIVLQKRWVEIHIKQSCFEKVNFLVGKRAILIIKN